MVLHIPFFFANTFVPLIEQKYFYCFSSVALIFGCFSYPIASNHEMLCPQGHIRTFGGRVVETILSLRFFIFQYGVVYKLDLQGNNTSLMVVALFITCFLIIFLWTGIQFVNFCLLRVIVNISYYYLLVLSSRVYTTLISLQQPQVWDQIYSLWNYTKASWKAKFI